ncbi:MAG TPA: hypothetical protein VGR58_06110 [Candidatus Acidoferrum sp.]|nr:hypothetical protein [Candidatus Acidoferrum sp.]
MKRRASTQKPRRRVSKKNRSHRATAQAKFGSSSRKYGMGSEIAADFRGIGLKPGEEIQELHDIKLQIPDFEE